MNFERPPVYFDIETGPLPRSEVEQFMPEFEKPKNYKDDGENRRSSCKKGIRMVRKVRTCRDNRKSSGNRVLHERKRHYYS